MKCFRCVLSLGHVYYKEKFTPMNTQQQAQPEWER
jgi:hypothetical protein